MKPIRKRNKLYDVGTLVLWVIACSVSLAQDKARPSTVEIQQRTQSINNALTAAAQVQHQVADYRQRNGKFPSSNDEAAVGGPGSFANADVSSVTVEDNGVVEVRLTAASGVADGAIILTPNLSQNTGENNVDWKCASASYATISDDTNGVCEYSKVPSVSSGR